MLFLRSFRGFGGKGRDVSRRTLKSPGTRLTSRVKYTDPRVPRYPDLNARRVFDPTHTRTGSARSGYYPSGTRVIDERSTPLLGYSGSRRTQYASTAVVVACIYKVYTWYIVSVRIL